MFNQTDVILVLGQRGCGKSTLGKKVQGIFPRRFVFDTLWEYPESEFDCYSFEEFSQRLLATANQSQFTIVYRPDPNTEDFRAEFDEILKCLFARGNILIVIEEVQLYASTHFLPKWLRNCLLTGRHAGVGLVLTTQRPGECHKTIISQCHHLFAGMIFEKNDVEYVRSFMGDAAYQLKDLPKYEFYYFRPGEPLKKVKNSLD